MLLQRWVCVHVSLLICLRQVSFLDLNIFSSGKKLDFSCCGYRTCTQLFLVWGTRPDLPHMFPETLPDFTNKFSHSITHKQFYRRKDSVSSWQLCLYLPQQPVCRVLTCLGVSSLVGDLVDGVQQSLLVTVRVQLELSPGVVTELGDGHLSDNTGTQLINNNKEVLHWV